jgi:TrmH family RNA methyltransferase
MEITSVNNKLIKEMVKLHHKKYRDETGLFLVEGYHLYEEAKKVGNIQTVFTVNQTIIGPKVIYVTEPVLSKLAKIQSPQGIITICRKVENYEIKNKVLLLDHIQDPGNLGTLLRSALAFDFGTIVLDNTVDLYNDKVIRSTQGALYKLNIIEKDAITFFKENSEYTVYGTSMNGININEIDTDQKLILVLGNEGSGVREEILEYTHKNVTIKTNEVDSLNVGVAGSIIMHNINNN